MLGYQNTQLFDSGSIQCNVIVYIIFIIFHCSKVHAAPFLTSEHGCCVLLSAVWFTLMTTHYLLGCMNIWVNINLSVITPFYSQLLTNVTDTAYEITDKQAVVSPIINR